MTVPQYKLEAQASGSRAIKLTHLRCLPVSKAAEPHHREPAAMVTYVREVATRQGYRDNMSDEEKTDASHHPQRNEHFRWDGADLLIHLRISPRASRDQVAGLMGDRLRISITAPPVDGKANAHLEKFIGKQLGVAKSLVAVVSGKSSRDKTVRITDPQILPELFLVTRTID